MNPLNHAHNGRMDGDRYHSAFHVKNCLLVDQAYV